MLRKANLFVNVFYLLILEQTRNHSAIATCNSYETCLKNEKKYWKKLIKKQENNARKNKKSWTFEKLMLCELDL